MATERAHDLVLHGFYGSFCTQKVHLALAEKGVVAERRPVNIGPPMENYEPWYAAINPRMVVPTLVHDGTAICDSSRIIRYIDEHFDGPPLRPADQSDREHVDALVDAVDALAIRELSYGGMKGALAVMRDRVLMPRRVHMLKRYRLADPQLTKHYDARLEDIASWRAELSSPETLAKRRNELETVLDDLDQRLVARQFLVSNTYSLADLMSTVLCARLIALKLANLERYPHLLAHYGRMKSRPRFPSDDIVERPDVRKLLRLFAPFVVPRLLLALLVLSAIIFGLYLIVS